MAGGAYVKTGGRKHEGKTTAFVLISCSVAAMGGLIFGYDVGITGGITSMESLLVKFVAIIASFYCYHNLKIVWTQAIHFVPIYLSEMTLAKFRGVLNIEFQMMITVRILSASLINYATLKHKNGRRVSLGIRVVSAVLLCVGSFCLEKIPNSLIERGQYKICGTNNVDVEYEDLVDASEAASKMENPWKNIIRHKYRPQLTFCSFIPVSQQFTGINVIIFYAPSFCVTKE
ncbi:hypothetical protein HN51_033561 [Arachis hypogaea]